MVGIGVEQVKLHFFNSKINTSVKQEKVKLNSG